MPGIFGAAQTKIFEPQDPKDQEEVVPDKKVEEPKKSGMFGAQTKTQIFEPKDDDEMAPKKSPEEASNKQCSTSDRRFQKQCQDVNLFKGCGGQNVQDAQNKLIEKGFNLPRFGADCRFGSETKNAVKSFQSKNSLPQTGKINQVTHDKLFAVNESKILNQYDVINSRHESLEKLVFERLVKGCK